MKKSKIILIIILVLVGLAVLFFAYGVIKKRYFPSGAENANIINEKKETMQNNNPENINQETTSPENGASPGNVRPDITSADCDKNCDNFKDNPENLKYCQEVCGQARIVPKNSKEECANLAGLEKDYCLRDLAVTKKDAGICNEIADGKIKTVCKNRVAEEILN